MRRRERSPAELQIGCDRTDDGDAASSHYVDAIHTAWRESQSACRASHERCVSGLKDAWKQTPSDRFDPAGLIAVANGLAVIAGHSATTIGNLDVFSATGVPPPEDAYPAGAATA